MLMVLVPVKKMSFPQQCSNTSEHPLEEALATNITHLTATIKAGNVGSSTH